MHAAVEEDEVLLFHFALADLVEHVEQCGILLPEHLLELDQRGAGALAQRGKTEEERAAELRLQVLGHLRIVDDGRQLVQVAEQRQAHPAEGLARPAAVDAQRLVDGPHQVGAHHRHLVDDEELEPAHEPAVAAAADVVGSDQPRREAEEGMDGLAADVDGGEAGRRQDHHLVGEQLLEAGQQRRFAGAGAPGDEQVAVTFPQVIVGGLVLARRRDAGRPSTGVGWEGCSGGAMGHVWGPVPELGESQRL